MPVLSLPEYLGIQEAPQQPVFQRTRQLAQPRSPWERDAQIADAMTQLRQQQPLSQIQAVQNEYDNIMMNAEKIRREREAASQAERAVSALAGLTPESDNYLTQRRQIMTQFPSAVLDPRVQSIMDDSDRMFNARQSSAARMEQERLAAEAARADEIQKRATSLIEMGVPPDQAMRDAQSPYTAAQAKFQRSQKPQGSRYEKALGTIQDLIRSVPEDERYDFVDGKQTVRPEFKALLDKQKQYADAYFREIEGEPVTPSATPRTAQIPFRPQEAPTAQSAPSIPKIASVRQPATPASPAPPAQAQVPVIGPPSNLAQLSAAIASPQASENDYLEYIKHPNVSLDQKREAFKALEKLAESPPPRADLDLNEAISRKETIQETLASAKEAIDRQDYINNYLNPAWTKAKAEIAKKVEDYAKKLGVLPENIYNTILKNEYIYNPKKGSISLDEEILGKDASKTNTIVSDAIKGLKEVESKSSPYRTALKQVLGEFGGRTNAGVLRALAEEKRKPLSVKTPDVSVATPLQVTSIQPMQ